VNLNLHLFSSCSHPYPWPITMSSAAWPLEQLVTVFSFPSSRLGMPLHQKLQLLFKVGQASMPVGTRSSN
ncbi:MAG: hypothetical protein AABY76_08280, partial [Planctomycetota bacterium]